jgi:hypothetical protein
LQGREKGLLEVVVALGGNLVVLETLLPVEDCHLCFHLPILDVHLVAVHEYQYVLAHPEGTSHRIMRRDRQIQETEENKRLIRFCHGGSGEQFWLPADVPVPGGDILVGEP